MTYPVINAARRVLGRPPLRLGRETSYIDSSGLGFLVMAHSRAMQAGGKMPIFGLNRRSLELMILTKLTTVFELYETEGDAVNSCFAGRKVQHFDILDFVQRHRGESGNL